MKTYTFNELLKISESSNKTLMPNTLAIRLDDTISDEGGLSQYVNIVLHGNSIMTVECFRREWVYIRLLPESFNWHTFLTTTRLNMVFMAYGYKCHRLIKDKIYEVFTSLDSHGKVYKHLIYPDSYPLIVTPHYSCDWINTPERGYM